jgi:hypothetical protein
MSRFFLVNTRGIRQFAKGICKESAADHVKSHNISRIFNSSSLKIYSHAVSCTIREDALMLCQFRLRIAKRLKQD